MPISGNAAAVRCSHLSSARLLWYCPALSILLYSIPLLLLLRLSVRRVAGNVCS